MKTRLIGLFVVSAAMATQAGAANYGAAGCGLGAMVIGDQPGKIQILAATLNNIVSPQTSAITSGTSNCYEENRSEEMALFISINHQALMTDISRGNGETIVGLSKILGCSDVDGLGSALQKNFKAIYPQSSTSAKDVGSSIESSIRKDESLARNCKIYG
jgi:hypothetical protein